MITTNRANVVIIGGGIIGCSVAYHLAERGCPNVVLLERRELASAETKSSVAMVMHQTGDIILSRLAKRSIKMYREYIDSNQWNSVMHQEGSILYTTEAARVDSLERMAAMQTDLGVDCRIISNSEIKSHIPFVKVEDILCGVYCPSDGHIDQMSALCFFSESARAKGVKFMTNCGMISIRTSEEKIFGVETSHGFIACSHVVNAAGAFSSAVARSAGIKLPITANKREVMVITPNQRWKEFPIFEDVGEEWYLRPEGDDILIGVGPTNRVDVENERESLYSPIFKEAARVEMEGYLRTRAPGLLPLVVKREWAGIRSFTPDYLPILGPVDYLNGYFNCCGMSGFGVTIAPAVGALTADLIVGETTTEFDIQALLLSRFPNDGTNN